MAAKNNQKTFDLSNVRNRIVERRMMKPSELLEHPGQWREHTESQAAALVGVLEEIGITDSIKAYFSERAGGKLVTWDGHLRRSLDPDIEWPVDITDLTDSEADFAHATHDPLGAMAGADAAALDSLLGTINTSNPAVQQMLSDLAAESGLYVGSGDGDGENTDGGKLLELTNVSVDDPKYSAQKGEIIHLGGHVLAVMEVINEWALWTHLLKPNMLLATYAGPFVPMTIKVGTFPVLMVQPDPYIAGHIVDRWIEIHGEETVRREVQVDE